MGTITVSQAGRTYRLVLSNKGLRVEHEGQEIFRHWPEDGAGPGSILPGPAPRLYYTDATISDGELNVNGLSMPATCVVFDAPVARDAVAASWRSGSQIMEQGVFSGSNRVEFAWPPSGVVWVAFVADVDGNALVSDVTRFERPRSGS